MKFFSAAWVALLAVSGTAQAEIKSQFCSAMFSTLYGQRSAFSAQIDSADVQAFEDALPSLKGGMSRKVKKLIAQMKAYQGGQFVDGHVSRGDETVIMISLRGNEAIRQFQADLEAHREAIRQEDKRLNARGKANSTMFWSFANVAAKTAAFLGLQAVTFMLVADAYGVSMDQSMLGQFMETIAKQPFTLVPSAALPMLTSWTSILNWFRRYTKKNSVRIDLDSNERVQLKSLSYEVDPYLVTQASSPSANINSDPIMDQIGMDAQTGLLMGERNVARSNGQVLQVQIEQALVYADLEPVLVIRATAKRPAPKKKLIDRIRRR